MRYWLLAAIGVGATLALGGNAAAGQGPPVIST